MSTLKLKGSTSGYVELTAPATAGNNTITLPTTAGTVAVKDASNNTEVGTGVTIGSPSSNTFTVSTNGSERLRVDSSGRLAVGTSTPDANLDVVRTSSGTVATFGIEGLTTNPRLRIDADESNNTVSLNPNYSGGSPTSIVFKTGEVERCRLDASGRLLIGTSTAFTCAPVATAYNVGIEGISNYAVLALKANINNSDGCYISLGKSRGTTADSRTVVSNNDMLGMLAFDGADGSAMRVGAAIATYVDGTPGTNDMPGRLVFSTTADGASSPTERMRITQAGAVIIGKTIAADNTAGTYTLANGQTSHTVSGDYPLYINRLTNDGTLIRFDQDTVFEGSISVSGTTVSYNGAHLSRWSQLPSVAERIEILRGSVLSNLDEMCEWGDEDNEQLNRMKVSDVEGDKNVAGVFQAWDDDDDTYTNDFYCAMTGDFIIRIGSGVTVERGDLLMSAGDGTAKPQDDDIVRSKTVAKVTSTSVTCTYDDGSYCVPCVLMAC